MTRKNDMKLHQIFIAINITIIPSFRMQCHTERKGNRMQGKLYKSIHYIKYHMQSMHLASSPYYHKSIEKAREMIQAHIVQRGSHGGDGVARPDSMGKTEDGHVVMTSGTTFFSGCRF